MSIVQPVPNPVREWTPASFDAFKVDLTSVFNSPPPERDFVLPGLLRGTVGPLVAPGASGKSFLLMTTILSVAMGKDLGGLWDFDPTQGPAVYLGLEDPKDETESRLHHIGAFIEKAEQAGLSEKVEFLVVAGEGFAVATKRGDAIVPHPAFTAFEARLLVMPSRPRLLVIETFNRAISTGGINESDNGDMGAVMGILEGLAKRVGCAIIVSHHTTKASALSGQGDAQQAARGASAITDNARWQANLITMTKEEATKMLGKGKEEKRKFYVRLELTKTNYGAPRPARWLKRGEGGVLEYAEDLVGGGKI